jgi:hypothetical protein
MHHVEGGCTYECGRGRIAWKKKEGSVWVSVIVDGDGGGGGGHRYTKARYISSTVVVVVGSVRDEGTVARAYGGRTGAIEGTALSEPRRGLGRRGKLSYFVG